MFIKYNPKDPHVKTIPVSVNSIGGKTVPLSGDSIILRPGTNELTEQEWAAIQPHLQDEIKNKIIVPFTVEIKKAGGITKARTLKDVPVSVARKIIESCQNVADLKKWVKQELPDEIMLLVLKRLRKLRVDPDEFSDDPTGEDTLDDDITPEGGTPEGDDASETGGENVPEGGRRRGKNGARGKPKPQTSETEPEGGGDGDDPEDDDDEEIPDFDGSGGKE